MRNIDSTLLCCFSAAMIISAGCSKNESLELKTYPVESMRGVVDASLVSLDAAISSDGNGSLRITVNEPTTVRLYETGDIDVENTRVTYRAKVRTEGLEGKAYLEMWCCFPAKGEYFSRDLISPLSGTREWSQEETEFFLREGENPNNVKLNIVVDGKGTVWVDDIHLVKDPTGTRE
ncbi:MAG: hypothetical protein QHI48_06320 [Bacteroidota bacterium]|nr:hypothetical protein [Bacteroidota bacterium]